MYQNTSAQNFPIYHCIKIDDHIRELTLPQPHPGGSSSVISRSAVFYPGIFGGGIPPQLRIPPPPKNLRRGLLPCECNTCKLTECSKLTK